MEGDVLTKAEAKKIILFNEEDMTHTFFNMVFGIIGSDHSKKSILKDIDKSHMCKKTGEQALAMGHGLVVIPAEKCKQSDLLFVETKKSFNEKRKKQLSTESTDKENKNG